MEIKEEQICRICLKEIYKEFEVLDETWMSMFDILLLKMNWNISKALVMCQECMEITRKCFNFKTACINTESIVQSLAVNKMEGKLELRDLYEYSQTTRCEDFNICRFCMDRLETSRFVPLNILLNELEILPTLIPELDLTMTKNSQICILCRESLECYVKFAQNCADIEEKISKYYRDKGFCNMEEIKLSSIVPFLNRAGLKYPSDSTLVPVIKKETDAFEELLVKTEEPLDIKEENFVSVEISSKTSSEQSEAYFHKEMGDTVFTRDLKHDCDNIQRFIHNQDPSDAVKIYKCSLCTYKTKYRYCFTSHLIIHKNPLETMWYKCTDCFYKTKRKSSLTTHLLIHSDPEKKWYICSFCNYRTKKELLFNCHILIHNRTSKIKV